MNSSSQSLRINPRLALANVGRLALLVLDWLVASTQAAAFLALVALGADAFGLAPLLTSDPAERLLWIVMLGAVAGLARQVDMHVSRRRP